MAQPAAFSHGTDYRQQTDRVTLANTIFIATVDHERGSAPEITEIRTVPVDNPNSFGAEFDLALAAELHHKGQPLLDFLLDAVCPKVRGI